LPAEGRAEYYDPKTQGLALRISPKGGKSTGLSRWAGPSLSADHEKRLARLERQKDKK